MPTINLPDAFLNRMKEELGDEFENFIASYDNPRAYGLRCNLLKSGVNDFIDKMPFKLEPVDWSSEGFYYDENERPGKHPYHEAGAYYIQEPSAMSAVALLDPKPGDVVLDLCAAPGGKSTQIGARLNGKGLLVTNEINGQRALVLSSNVERMGLRNAIVTSEPSDKLSRAFPMFFDKILVDAPCSGEGMFRKEENAIPEWSPENVELCATRQSEILDNAASMLKAGGVLVYSTCTFSRAENEDNIEAFLSRHPEFSLETQERLMPHKLKGEGHFVARLIKAGNRESVANEEASIINASCKICSNQNEGKNKNKKAGNSNGSALSAADIASFLEKECHIKKEVVESMLSDSLLSKRADKLFLTPADISSVIPLIATGAASSRSGGNINILRPGLWAVTDLGKRLEPAHSLAMTLRPEEVDAGIHIGIEDALKYIEGQTLTCSPDIKGWVCVFVDGFSIGWGKASNGTVKNHYPKGLRASIVIHR